MTSQEHNKICTVNGAIDRFVTEFTKKKKKELSL